MSSVKISVIVPVFNSQMYLRETLNALSQQSFRDLEIILVDDGSSDGSPQIADAYARNRDNVIVLHTENSGEYNARLAGIRLAKGKYIAFCDSDDLPLPDMLEKMYMQAEKTGADITVCGFIREEMETGRVLSKEMLSFEARSYGYPEMMDVLPLVNVAVWNKLFRAELLRHLLLFDKPPRIASDLLFCCSLYPFIRNVAFVPELLYRYRVREDSVLFQIVSEDLELIRCNMLQTRVYVLENDSSPEMRELLDSTAFVHFGLSMVVRQTQAGEKISTSVWDARSFLECSFPGYKKAGKGLVWNLRHHMMQFRILLGRWFFCAHLMTPFLLVYNFVTRRLKKEIKW